MRISPLRHPVAVLRQIVQMGQSELAALSDCSSRTIQAVELGQLALSEGLALKIAQATGVSLQWILDGDPALPPKADCPSGTRSPDRAYTYHVFEAHRAELEIEAGAKAGGGRENTTEQIVAAGDFHRGLEKDDAKLLTEFKKLLDETRYDDARAIVRWRLKKNLAELTGRYSKATADSFNKRGRSVSAKKRTRRRASKAVGLRR